jgi:hypothetical protein
VQPYVIRQGDYLALLAYKFGFDADAVWNDPKNADLRKIRSDPNMLWPTDVPAPSQPPPSSSVPPSSPSSSPGDGGLSDDGTLDDATTQLLLQAHGS